MGPDYNNWLAMRDGRCDFWPKPSCGHPGEFQVMTVIANAERSRTLRGMVLVAASAVVWSSGGPIVRSLESADTWTTIFWRSLFACVFLIAFMSLRRGHVVQQFIKMGLPGFFVGVSFASASISLVIALRLTTVANTLMIMSASPLFAAIMGRIFLGEAIRPITYVTIAAVMGGFALMVCDSLDSWSFAGDLFALVIAISYATSVVLTRRYHLIGMVPAACWGTIIATLVALPMASPLAITAHDLPILLLFGMGQLGIGLALFAVGASMIPASNTALLGMIEAVLGTLWTWLMFGERPVAFALAGGCIILASIAANAFFGLKQQTVAAPLP
jgi:drug/metabolite transporter (DMT)-like permease